MFRDFVMFEHKMARRRFWHQHGLKTVPTCFPLLSKRHPKSTTKRFKHGIKSNIDFDANPRDHNILNLIVWAGMAAWGGVPGAPGPEEAALPLDTGIHVSVLNTWPCPLIGNPRKI